MAYLLVTENGAQVFIDQAKISTEVEAEMKVRNVKGVGECCSTAKPQERCRYHRAREKFSRAVVETLDSFRAHHLAAVPNRIPSCGSGHLPQAVKYVSMPPSFFGVFLFLSAGVWGRCARLRGSVGCSSRSCEAREASVD